jgi:hypothetical protein
MKNSLAAFLILAGSVAASAAVSTPGNLVLGFRAETGTTGESNNVVIDLGALSSIITDTRNTYNLSGTSSILSTTYGTNWFNRTDLYYGVIANDAYEINGGDDYYQSFASTRLANSGSVTLDAISVYTAQPTFQQFALNNSSTALSSGTISGATRGGGFLTSDYLVLDSADSASWSTLSAAGWGGLFTESQDNLVTSYTSSTSALGIYTAAGGLNDFNQTIPAAVYIQSGYLVVVPEPSTYMLLALSGVALLYIARRKKA